MSAASPRVVVVGLDGASFELLDPWIEAGDMPNLAALVARGVRGGLESVVPPLTPPAWTSAVTGVHPGKHGIYNFIRPLFTWSHIEFLGTAHRKAPALWDLLAAHGKRSVVLHLPATFPPPRIDGLLVSGLPITNLDADCTWPRELKTELQSAVPGYKLYPDTINMHEDRDRYFADTIETLRRQGDEAVYLMNRPDWSLFFTLWHMGDPLKHYFWKDMAGETGDARRAGYIREYYREADRQLGRVVDAAGPDAHVIVMSDHGHGGVRRAVHLNGWLSQNGFLRLNNPFKATLAQRMARKFLPPKLARMVKNSSLRTRGASASDRGLQIKVGVVELFKKAVVWDQTLAYAEKPGFICVNVKGRSPMGVVEPGDEFRRVRDEIRAGMLAVRDPETGESVFEQVFVGEEIYQGAAASEAPDLVVLPRPGYLTEYGVGRGLIVGPVKQRGRSGYHVMRGMIAMAGPEIRRGERVEGASIVDVAPTILHLLCLPAQASMDGRVLEAGLTPEALAARSVRVEETDVALDAVKSSDDEREAVEQSLRDLGYM